MSGMRRLAGCIAGCAVLAGCVTPRPAPAPSPWEQRLSELEHASSWQLDGRAAVSLGTQGWQASLDWRQRGGSSEVHLAGPFGAGALVLMATPEGISLNGAPPSAEVAAQLRDRLGFELPINSLRFWLQGIPDPNSAFELTRNQQDRALQLTQGGWSIEYDKYMPNHGDLLPARLVLQRADARVRIAVDRWEWPK
ncbi:MAG: lipoprotein insertase outer membrane protein LolB [Steroidobacteraceae bacterium]